MRAHTKKRFVSFIIPLRSYRFDKARLNNKINQRDKCYQLVKILTKNIFVIILYPNSNSLVLRASRETINTTFSSFSLCAGKNSFFQPYRLIHQDLRLETWQNNFLSDFALLSDEIALNITSDPSLHMTKIA